MRKLKELFLSIVIIIASVNLPLLAIEAYLRFTQHVTKPEETSSHQFYVGDSELGWFHKPNARGIYKKSCFSTEVSINSFGLNDRELGKERKKTRVIVLGDSTTEGLQVEQKNTYPKVTEELLNKGVKKYEVFNFGVSGYGTAAELLLLKRYIEKIKPELIVLGFFPENDIKNNSIKLEGSNSPSPFYKLHRGTLIKLPNSCVNEGAFPCVKEMHGEPFQPLLSRVIKYLYGNWLIYDLLGGILAENVKVHELMWEVGLSSTRPKKLDQSYDVYRHDLPEEWEEAFELSLKLIQEIARTAKNSGSKFHVILLPSKSQIAGETMLCAGYSDCKSEEYDLGKINSRIAERLMANRVTVTDYRKVFLNNTNNIIIDDYFLVCDGHYTSAGHRLIGKTLSSEIGNLMDSK